MLAAFRSAPFVSRTEIWGFCYFFRKGNRKVFLLLSLLPSLINTIIIFGFWDTFCQCSGITPDCTGGAIWSSRDQIWVNCARQVSYLLYYSPTLLWFFFKQCYYVHHLSKETKAYIQQRMDRGCIVFLVRCLSLYRENSVLSCDILAFIIFEGIIIAVTILDSVMWNLSKPRLWKTTFEIIVDLKYLIFILITYNTWGRIASIEDKVLALYPADSDLTSGIHMITQAY